MVTKTFIIKKTNFHSHQNDVKAVRFSKLVHSATREEVMSFSLQPPIKLTQTKCVGLLTAIKVKLNDMFWQKLGAFSEPYDGLFTY